MIIAVDHGNSTIKTLNHTFPSGLKESMTLPPLVEDVISMNNRFWSLSGKRIPYMRDKTKDDRFYILTLFAVMMELKTEGALAGTRSRKIDLAVGLPPDHFSVQRDSFMQYLKRDVRFHHNDELFELSIDNIWIYPQAYAATACRMAELKPHSRVFVVDVGGYTTDVLLLRNGKPDMDYCHSFDMGIIGMGNEIARMVNTKYDIPIEDDLIGDVLSGKQCVLPRDVQATIRASAEVYAKRILDILREHEINLRAAPVVFLGGGSLLLRDYLTHSYMTSEVILETDTRANARGYLLLAQAQARRSSR